LADGVTEMLGVEKPLDGRAGALAGVVDLHTGEQINRCTLSLLADAVVALGRRELAVPHEGSEDFDGRAGIGVTLGVGVAERIRRDGGTVVGLVARVKEAGQRGQP
jgi:hypothetical protein